MVEGEELKNEGLVTSVKKELIQKNETLQNKHLASLA